MFFALQFLKQNIGMWVRNFKDPQNHHLQLQKNSCPHQINVRIPKRWNSNIMKCSLITIPIIIIIILVEFCEY